MLLLILIRYKAFFFFATDRCVFYPAQEKPPPPPPQEADELPEEVLLMLWNAERSFLVFFELQLGQGGDLTSDIFINSSKTFLQSSHKNSYMGMLTSFNELGYYINADFIKTCIKFFIYNI